MGEAASSSDITAFGSKEERKGSSTESNVNSVAPNPTQAFVKDRLFIFLTLLLACCYRFDFLIASDFRIDADEGIVGLMAKHILDGAEIPVFYYGQHYMGSLEALLVAGAFKIFGVTSFALKIVPLLFSLLFICLVYLTAHAISGKLAARIAALICAVPSISAGDLEQ